MGLENGILKEDSWKKFATDPSIEFEPPVWEEYLGKDELIKILNHAYKSFYMRPGYIFRRIWEVKSWQELKRKAKAAIRMRKI